MELSALLEGPPVLHVADSRLVEPGCVFYALKGERVDGHDYVEEARDRGALCAVVERDVPNSGIPLIRVHNVLAVLHALAKRCVEKYSEKTIIGVTGSCGKTTTKEFIGTLLEEEFAVERSPASWNSQVTMPLCILNLLRKAEILVLEMALSQKGDIQKLTDIAMPQIVVLTPIGYAHSAFFADIEEIAAAKAEIFSSKRLQHAFIHKDSIGYVGVQKSVCCPFELFGREVHPDLPFTESHLIENADGAVKVGRHFNMRPEKISSGLLRLAMPPRRFNKKSYRGVTIVDDTYNANPTSMVTALVNLPLPDKGGRRIGVLGSMGELGAYEKEGHQMVGERAVEILDELLCIGEPFLPVVDIFQQKQKKVSFFQEYDEMKAALKQSMREGDVVLVKGSNFHKMWKMIDYID